VTSFILEQVNGVASILTFCLLVFLTFYLWDWLIYKHTSVWKALWVGLPPAIALAGVMYLEKMGTLMTRAVVWAWRMMSDGKIPFSGMEMFFLLLGALTTSAALLLMIRLLSRPRFGELPWVISLILAVGFVVISTGVHLWS
jgi:hypothetical protein